MLTRINSFICCICLILLYISQAKAEMPQVTDQAKVRDERERAHLRLVDKQFVVDLNILLQQYKKDFGGGNYHIELLRDLRSESQVRGLKSTPAMLNCREQYIIDLYTLKREKEHVVFYCMDGDKPVKTGFYTKNRTLWKLDGK